MKPASAQRRADALVSGPSRNPPRTQDRLSRTIREVQPIMHAIRRAAGHVVPFALAVGLFFVINLIIPGYANLNSFLSLLLLSSLLGLAAVGQTLTIVIGGFDMSIPAVIGLANVLMALLYGAGWPVWLAAALIFAVAGTIGLVNGFAS